MINKDDITGIILSGGKSSRMGTDKGFISLNGKPFIQHVIDALQPLVSETIIVSDHKAYDTFKLKRIEDVMKNTGPLAGIYSGLNASTTTYNLVLSCDVPLITTKILTLLIERASPEDDIIQIENKGKTMPLIALYKKSCAQKFLKLLQHGERRLQFAVNQCKIKTITLSPESADYTKNVNTPDELKSIENDY